MFGGAGDLSGSTRTFPDSSTSVASLLDLASGTTRPLHLKAPHHGDADANTGVTGITPSAWAQRMSHSATLLPGGKVVILGGCGFDIRPDLALPASETDNNIPLMLLVDTINGHITRPDWTLTPAASTEGKSGRQTTNENAAKDNPSDAVILVRHSAVLMPSSNPRQTPVLLVVGGGASCLSLGRFFAPCYEISSPLFMQGTTHAAAQRSSPAADVPAAVSVEAAIAQLRLAGQKIRSLKVSKDGPATPGELQMHVTRFKELKASHAALIDSYLEKEFVAAKADLKDLLPLLPSKEQKKWKRRLKRKATAGLKTADGLDVGHAVKRARSKGGRGCYLCGLPGHRAKACPNVTQKRPSPADTTTTATTSTQQTNAGIMVKNCLPTEQHPLATTAAVAPRHTSPSAPAPEASGLSTERNALRVPSSAAQAVRAALESAKLYDPSRKMKREQVMSASAGPHLLVPVVSELSSAAPTGHDAGSVTTRQRLRKVFAEWTSEGCAVAKRWSGCRDLTLDRVWVHATLPPVPANRTRAASNRGQDLVSRVAALLVSERFTKTVIAHILNRKPFSKCRLERVGDVLVLPKPSREDRLLTHAACTGGIETVKAPRGATKADQAPRGATDDAPSDWWSTHVGKQVCGLLAAEHGGCRLVVRKADVDSGRRRQSHYELLYNRCLSALLCNLNVQCPCAYECTSV